MAALTSCCSKAHFHHGRFGSSSPRRVCGFRFSVRFERSKCRFLQIQMLQNKPIVVSPLHAVPSQPPKDLETDQEPQAQQTEVVGVQFQLQKDYIMGEEIFLVCKDHKSGAWDLKNAIPMTWSEGHRGWFAELVDVPATWTSIQYKYIVKSASGDAIWQRGPHRLVMFWPTFKRITICEEWRRFRTKEKTIDDTSVGKLSLKPRFEFSTLQNTGRISLVDAVPPVPQEDYLEIDDGLQPQRIGEKTKFVRVQFQLQKDYTLGEQLLFVRDPAWGLQNALPMTWSEEHHWWFAEVDVPAGKFYMYRFVLKSTSGDAIWQPAFGQIVATSKTYNRITICEEWGDQEHLQRYFRKSQEQSVDTKV